MKLINRRASYEYQILDKFEAGISLTGPEVKSVKNKRLIFEGSFIRIADGEAWLCNAHIAPYEFADNRSFDPKRNRRLLMHKKEIMKIQTEIREKGLTVVPLSCYTMGGKIKLEIALAKGKKEYKKREVIKRRDMQREVEQSLKIRN